MDVAATQAATSTKSVTAGTQAESVLTSDFETFLQMMTTQAKYQDPLDPLDSAEYASQLAQFSSVEQQLLTNELLGGLSAHVTGNLTQFASWIGRDARTVAPVQFNNEPIEVQTPGMMDGADKRVLVVINELGKEVQRIELSDSASDGSYFWDGTDGNGSNAMEPGLYAFDIEQWDGDKIMAQNSLEAFARVTEARFENGQPIVVLNGGASVPVHTITALREPA